MSTVKRSSHAPEASLATASVKRTAWLLFIAAFLGTTAVALLVQLVMLPYFLPQLHAGHGLPVGGDSAGFEVFFMVLSLILKKTA